MASIFILIVKDRKAEYYESIFVFDFKLLAEPVMGVNKGLFSLILS